MAAMYLLGHPDHYTNHTFAKFFWRMYVREAVRTSGIREENEEEHDQSVILTKSASKYLASSPIFDYIYRPFKYQHMNLYDWIRLSKKVPLRKKKDISEEEPEEELFDDELDAVSVSKLWSRDMASSGRARWRV